MIKMNHAFYALVELHKKHLDSQHDRKSFRRGKEVTLRLQIKEKQEVLRMIVKEIDAQKIMLEITVQERNQS